MLASGSVGLPEVVGVGGAEGRGGEAERGAGLDPGAVAVEGAEAFMVEAEAVEADSGRLMEEDAAKNSAEVSRMGSTHRGGGAGGTGVIRGEAREAAGER